MLIEIDFSSDEAIYQQLCNQIILGIATEQYTEGMVLPSVRALADEIGINMHTVNKAYTVLKQEGYVKVDRRRGAVISVDSDKQRAMLAVRSRMQEAVAEALCRGLSREDMHELLDGIYDEYESLIHGGSAGRTGRRAGTSAGEEEAGAAAPSDAASAGSAPEETPSGTGAGSAGAGTARSRRREEMNAGGAAQSRKRDEMNADGTDRDCEGNPDQREYRIIRKDINHT